jgi:hypothetical protein
MHSVQDFEVQGVRQMSLINSFSTPQNGSYLWREDIQCCAVVPGQWWIVDGGWAHFAHDVVSLLTALREPSARKVKDQVERMLESVGVKRDMSARLQAIMALPRHRGTIEKHVSGHCSSASSVE